MKKSVNTLGPKSKTNVRIYADLSRLACYRNQSYSLPEYSIFLRDQK